MLRHKRQASNEAASKGPSALTATARQQQQLKQRQQQQQQSRSQRRFHDEHEEEAEEELLEDRWRQAAQLLTNEDELRLFGGSPQVFVAATERTKQGRSNNEAQTTVNRSRQQQNNDNHHAEEEEEDDDNSSISFAQSGCHSILSAWRLKAANRASSRQSRQSRRPISVLSNGSSAQSGKRSTAASTAFTARSSATAAGQRSGKSPASQTRMLLGPTSAQHFVTNSRRRRRANELILTTLEARRRALELNRQSASLLGSASYLAGTDVGGGGGGGCPANDLGSLASHIADYRLSLSPSPLTEAHSNFGPPAKSPSPQLNPNPNTTTTTKASLSDLGAHQPHKSAAEAQRNKLVLMSARQLRNSALVRGGRDQSGGKLASSLAAHHQQVPSAGIKRPPLAKLDQNSSDLNTTNSSSSGSESSSSSSSSGSQFTQLVTSELVANDCDLLEQQQQQQAIRSRLKPLNSGESQHQQRRPTNVSSSSQPTSPHPQKPASSPSAKAPERARRTKQKSPSEKSLIANSGQRHIGSPTDRYLNKSDQAQTNSERVQSKLRRGALRRDSIRRLRLNRSLVASSQHLSNDQSSSSSSSSDVAAPSSDSSAQHTNENSRESNNNNSNSNNNKFQALSEARRLDIESNPFLNRHHFRTTSVRNNSTGRASEFGADGTSSPHPRPPPRPAQPVARPANLGGSREGSMTTRVFGLAGRPTNASEQQQETKAIKRVEPREPRTFLQARRAQSTEQVAGSGHNKVSKQEGVKQVERMLREMKPNQVFTSHRLDEKELLARMSSVETRAEPQELQSKSNWRQQSFSNRSSEQHRVSHDNYPNARSAATSAGLDRKQQQQQQQYQEAKSSTVPNATKVATTTTTTTTTIRPSRFTSDFGEQNNNENEPRKLITRNEQQHQLPVANQGSRLRDDLNFDRMGNRRQYELLERWKHDRTTSPLSDEERFISKRMELIRSSSISPPPAFAEPAKQHRFNYATESQSARANEPQVNEADRCYSKHRTRLVVERVNSGQPVVASIARRSLSEERPLVTARRPKGTPVPSSNQSKVQVKPQPQQQQQQQQQQQVVVQQLSSGGAPGQVSLPKFESTAEDEFKKRVDYLRKLARANLSSDASVSNEAVTRSKSNAKSMSQQPICPEAQKPPPVSTTKPMSTNWRQKDSSSVQQTSSIGAKPKTPSSGRPSSLLADDERARWNFGPLAASGQPLERVGSQLAAKQAPAARNLATTNLDLALLADRYQTLRSNQRSESDVASASAGGKWRRSNSSLASVGRPVVTGSAQPAQRAASPPLLTSGAQRAPQAMHHHQQLVVSYQKPGNQMAEQQQQQQTTTRQPVELMSSAVVKLVVKEKSAPELDYAFVEQQPVVQRARQMDAPQPNKLLANTFSDQSQQALPNQRQVSLASKQRTPPSMMQQSQYQAKFNLETNRTPISANNNTNAILVGGGQTRQTQIRSPLRVSSPRSPEFGNMAASSNDDSAIASSVSSPSLSFMLNPAGGGGCGGTGEQPPVVVAHQPRPIQQVLSTGVRSASPSSSALRSSLSQQVKSRQAENSNSGALQSILRRHQQNQLGQSATGYSSDSSSQAQTSRSSALQIGYEPSSTAATRQQQQATRPQEPLFRSDARSPEPAQNALRSDRLVSIVDQAGDNQPLGAADSSSPPKRVHFNDRTSIRSFESISSLVSNSTAVPNNNLLIRQQVGSPDSLGSGSTSRLSAESPDLRRTGTLGGGAAIYAVRGDPELEEASERTMQRQQQQQQQQQQHRMLAGQIARPVNVGQPAAFDSLPARQLATASSNPLLYHPIARYDPANQAFIRMTAPPRISTSGNISPRTIGGPRQSMPIQYIVKPTSMTTTQIVPTMMGPSSMQLDRMKLQIEEDNEEPDYALRLRQAATSRVFSYTDSLASSASASASASASQQQRHLSPPLSHQVRQQQQQQQPNRRLAMEDLLNFQTEV